MNFGLKKLLNAAKSKLKGTTVPAKSAYGSRNYTPIERPITYDVLTAAASIHKVSSSMSQIARLAFYGFDPVITAPKSEDPEIAKKRIAEALAHWEEVNAKIGDVGMVDETGTLGLIRRSFFDTSIYKKALFEYRTTTVDGWFDPTEIQWIPSNTLNRSPPNITSEPARYVVDTLLRGVFYDRVDHKTRFNQTIDSTTSIILEPENCVYVEDMLVVGLSTLANLMPSIREWLNLRRNLMLVSHEAGTPKQVISFIEPADDDEDFNVDELTTQAEKILQAGPEENAFLVPYGLQMNFPSVPVPVNPQDPDSYLRDEIRDHFFPKDWYEQSSQAISSTSNPLKVLMDMMLGGHRETNGVPWERFWTKWLHDNGYIGYKFTFKWWDLAPKDELAIRAQDRADVIAGIITEDEARANRDPPLPPLTPAQRAQIAARKGVKAPIRVQNVPPDDETTLPGDTNLPMKKMPDDTDEEPDDKTPALLQSNCPADEKIGVGPGSCGGGKTQTDAKKNATSKEQTASVFGEFAQTPNGNYTASVKANSFDTILVTERAKSDLDEKKAGDLLGVLDEELTDAGISVSSVAVLRYTEKSPFAARSGWDLQDGNGTIHITDQLIAGNNTKSPVTVAQEFKDPEKYQRAVVVHEVSHGVQEKYNRIDRTAEARWKKLVNAEIRNGWMPVSPYADKTNAVGVWGKVDERYYKEVFAEVRTLMKMGKTDRGDDAYYGDDVPASLRKYVTGAESSVKTRNKLLYQSNALSGSIQDPIKKDEKLLQLHIRSILPTTPLHTMKTWRTRPQKSASGACKKCAAMEGETVPINEPYSNGLMHANECHPNGKCYDEYS